MAFTRQLRPIRIVLRWQLIATAVLTLVAMAFWGLHGALSAALGGGVNVLAGWVYGWRVSRGGEAKTAAEALAKMFRAEAYKIVLIILGIAVVLTTYRDIVHAAFFASFVITVMVFAAAIAVRDTDNN